MYVWEIELEEHWTWHEDGEYESFQPKMHIAAETGEAAVAKAKQLRIGATSENEEGEPQKCLDARLIYLEQGDELDG